MEYLVNGDFSTGQLDPWRPVLGADIPVIKEGDHYHAQMSGGEKLNQRFSIDDLKPRDFTVTVEFRVVDGAKEDTGKVQFIWSSSSISDTHNLEVSDGWQTVTFVVSLSKLSYTNNAEMLVQPNFNKEVSVRRVSFAD